MSNIYQRVNEVMKKVAYVQKDKRVENYMAVTHDMVTAMVRSHFVEAGIIMVPRLVAGQLVDTGKKSKSDNPAMRYEGKYEIDFVNMDDPAEYIRIPIEAHGEDYGDKAPGKALSYATKYAILKLLMLETGENDESRVAPEKVGYSEHEEMLLQKLRDASMNGEAALKVAWEALHKDERKSLAMELGSLKAAAKEADAITAKAA